MSIIRGRKAAIGAVAIAALLFTTTVAVPAMGGPKALSAASLAGKVTKALKKSKRANKRSKVAKARANEALAKAGTPGPAGPAGPKGDKGDTGAVGPPGPSTGAAGGELAGNYPNPTLAAGAVDAADLGSINIRSDLQVIATGTGASVEANCLPGEVLITGGTTTIGVGLTDGWDLIRSGPNGNGWSAAAWNTKGSNGTLVVRALCLEP